MIKDITLGQFLKYRNIVSSGGEAKMLLQVADVKVNGEPERRRGKKLKQGDMVEVDGKTFVVE
jgi:ribosome-associated protein